MAYDLFFNGSHYRYEQITIPVPRVDALAWMQKQSHIPKMYWKGKDEEAEYVALGNILSFTSPPVIAHEEGLRINLFGGRSFAHVEEDLTWKGFPHGLFFLPQFELRQDKNSTELTLHFINTEKNRDKINELSFDYPPLEIVPTCVNSRQDSPSKEQWEDMITASLQMIVDNKIAKVVLARKTTLTLDKTISPCALLKKIAGSQRASLFALQLESSSLWIGVSPERLFLRKKNTLITEAIAGTTVRGKNQEEDLLLQKLLLSSTKLHKEFSSVEMFLQEKISSLCLQTCADVTHSIHQTPRLQHLYKKLEGEITPPLCDTTIMERLHPTPAVGGFPTKEAIDLLLEKEPFSRGWYAAPIGMQSKDYSHFAVGIRTALLRENSIHLFAGTGVVLGSDPEEEWEELELKISQYVEMLSSS